MNFDNKDTTASEDKVRRKTEFLLKDKWNFRIKDFNWPYVIFHLISHVIAVYGILTFPYLSHKLTALWCTVMYNLFFKLFFSRFSHKLIICLIIIYFNAFKTSG